MKQKSKNDKKKVAIQKNTPNSSDQEQLEGFDDGSISPVGGEYSFSRSENSYPIDRSLSAISKSDGKGD